MHDLKTFVKYFIYSRKWIKERTLRTKRLRLLDQSGCAHFDTEVPR
jgi:hypothetical protein